MERSLELGYLPASCGEWFFLGALTSVLCVDFVGGQDVGCCKILTTWRQAASFKSRLLRLIDMNNAKSAL